MPPVGHRIRLCSIDDAGQVSELASETFRETWANHPIYTPRDVDLFASQLDVEYYKGVLGNGAQEVYVLEVVDGKAPGETDARYAPAGYAQLLFDVREQGVSGPDPCVEIQKFYFRSRYHRTGLAGELMQHVMWRARQVANTAWLGVHAQNEKAKRFYRKFGFEWTGQTKLFGVTLAGIPDIDQVWECSLPREESSV